MTIGVNPSKKQIAVMRFSVTVFLGILQVGYAFNNPLSGQILNSTCKLRTTTDSKLGTNLITIPESLYYQSKTFDSDLFSVQIEQDVLDGALTEDFLPFASLINEHFPTVFIFATDYKFTPRVAESFLKVSQPPLKCESSATNTRMLYLSVLLGMVRDAESEVFERLDDTITAAHRINNASSKFVVGIAVYLHLIVQQRTRYNEFLPWNQVNKHVSTMRSRVNAAGLSFGSIVWSDALANKKFYEKWMENVFPHLQFVYFQYWPCDSVALKSLTSSRGLTVITRHILTTHEQLVAELQTKYPETLVKVGISVYFMDCHGFSASFDDAARMWITLNNYSKTKSLPVTISPVLTKANKTFSEWFRVVVKDGQFELTAFNTSLLSPTNYVKPDNPNPDELVFEELLFGQTQNKSKCSPYPQKYKITNRDINFPGLSQDARNISFNRTLITVSSVPRTRSHLSTFEVIPFLLLTHTMFSNIRINLEKGILDRRASSNYAVMKSAALINRIEKRCGYKAFRFNSEVTPWPKNFSHLSVTIGRKIP